MSAFTCWDWQQSHGEVKLGVFVSDETLWLSQKNMAELFGIEVHTINYHLKEIFKSGELEEIATIRDFRIVQKEGNREVSREVAFYNLDAIIAVGYRVNSRRATQFRIWATNVLKEFFATVQNRFHYAITGQTAAEIIHQKANGKEPFMGLSTWKNAPEGRILASDVTIAKNYLSEKEIKKLERTISGFFDYIENIIENRQTFTMIEFAESVSKFLDFNEYKILQGNGSVSRKVAEEKALGEYQEYNRFQLIESDFDKSVKKLMGIKKYDQ
ncbi:MAG: RhuM family protein [bacterium]